MGSSVPRATDSFCVLHFDMSSISSTSCASVKWARACARSSASMPPGMVTKASVSRSATLWRSGRSLSS